MEVIITLSTALQQEYTTMNGKSPKNQELLVDWCSCGSMRVSSSDHSRWYDISCDRQGHLCCSCPDATYRPYRTCKHVWAAAQYLETYAPLTSGQRQFAQATARDRTREVLRSMRDYQDGPEQDCPELGDDPVPR